jgi:glucose/arabinose dehydrogenase
LGRKASRLFAGVTLAFAAALNLARGDDELRTGKSAFGDYRTDAPGVRRLITVKDLPTPYSSPTVDNGPRMVPKPADAFPKAPIGFQVDLLTTNLRNPRKISTAPNGDLFFVESEPGEIKVIRQKEDGTVASLNVYASKLRQPFGMAFYPLGPNPQYLYVGNTDSVVRFKYANGDLKAQGEPEKLADLPGGGRLRGGGHWTRDVVFTADSKRMFVSVGSFSNADDNDLEKERADVLEFNPDGTGRRIFATGLRNAVGLAIEPKTGVLWGSVNERDGLGDDLPCDYITRIREGGFYGWPWYYLGNHPDPAHHGAHPELAEKVIVPDVLLQAHSASLCMTFYTATQFPSKYHGWAFAAEHGSWNRARRTGYKVICVPVKDGIPQGEYDDFMTGFVVDDGHVWGRPVGVTVDKQGSLIVVDDGSRSIWRVRYVGGQ